MKISKIKATFIACKMAVKSFYYLTFEKKHEPFKIVFDSEADGGPGHFLHLMQGMCVQFVRNSVCIAEGIIVDVSDNYVVIHSYNPKTEEFDGDVVTFCFGFNDLDEYKPDFDTIVYM